MADINTDACESHPTDEEVTLNHAKVKDLVYTIVLILGLLEVLTGGVTRLVESIAILIRILN